MAESIERELADAAEWQEESGSEEEEEEGSESESEDEDSVEIEEPKLKYERIRNTLEEILSKDAASCMAVHTKFMAVGTHWGMVHVLDLQGNTIAGKEFAKHSTTVNQISLDMNGDYLSSCSDDGRVAITGLYEDEYNQIQAFDCPVKSLALDPRFSRSNSGRQFVTGSDKLTLHERGFFNRSKSTILHAGEGPIRTIKWRGCFVAWANDLGVKVFDLSSKRRITFIKRDHDEKLRPEIYPCKLCWKDNITLLVGWADTIKICVVKERRVLEGKDMPNRYVEIVNFFKTDFYVCGLAPMLDNLVVIAYMTDEALAEDDEQDDEGARRPQLKILTALPDDYHVVSSDALSIRGFQEYRPSDYHLEYLEGEGVFYIVSPKDIVLARKRDVDDHIAWLMENEKFEEALAETKAHAKTLHRHKVLDVGRAYLNHLIAEGEYDKAASMCEPILGKHKDLWEQEVFHFAKMHRLKAISHYIPRGDVRLSKAIYEMVLNDFLQTDLEGFHQLIKLWPSDLYDLMTLVCAVQDRLLRDPNNRILMQTLGELYSYDQRYDKALAIYLKLGHKDVFPLIHRHNLFDSIQDKIVMLMEFDTERAVNLLIENVDKVPVKKVVKQLEEQPKLLYHYLDALFHKHPHLSQDFQSLQVTLYAEFNRDKLLPFLRNSQHCPMEVALEVCTERHFIPEMVFLLGRMGNTTQALKLIIEEMGDVDKAIEFAKEHDDSGLWDELINASMNKPTFITGLLNNIGTHVDPVILIKRIKEGMEIPGLRDSLVQILQDYNLQMSLREGCKKILVSGCFTLLDRLNKIQKRGINVEEDHHCDSCHGPILAGDSQSTVVIFYCHHVFHEECLIAQNMEHCMICHSQRKGPGSVTAASR
ncbi:LOW QUALITY PROTEIN: vacuolar protein sorting-associated protein 41 homolog [Patiria miniata]|uniref:Vacuolar protein sorting-associated protein 41 homolog n=1 Tax=Patiria miniata TaxID=46514 RepID=A0A913Z0N3_PATMI|nr:LOW QUALITY PROTEIN: vacuolar protein sorting-associated protein 41 homolog [Patiria miniata]